MKMSMTGTRDVVKFWKNMDLKTLIWMEQDLLLNYTNHTVKNNIKKAQNIFVTENLEIVFYIQNIIIHTVNILILDLIKLLFTL